MDRLRFGACPVSLLLARLRCGACPVSLLLARLRCGACPVSLLLARLRCGACPVSLLLARLRCGACPVSLLLARLVRVGQFVGDGERGEQQQLRLANLTDAGGKLADLGVNVLREAPGAGLLPVVA